MARNRELLRKRNQQIERYFVELTKSYPHWKLDYVIQKVAEKFFLSVPTIEYILSKNKS